MGMSSAEFLRGRSHCCCLVVLRVTVRACSSDRPALLGPLFSAQRSSPSAFSFQSAQKNSSYTRIESAQVTDMGQIFTSASAFDQDLGWCLDEGVTFDAWGDGYTMQDAFDGTPCASTSCGVTQGGCP